MHIHILGICGTFMGGLARLAKEAGVTVSGCDAHVYPPMSEQLLELGVRLTEGYGADQVLIRPDIFVVGNAIARGNPLLEEILEKNLPYISGPQWLEENILKGRHVLCVSGTHGKTTTTSILTHILDKAGKNPSFLVGGVPQEYGLSARLTESPYFVIEGDEYDTAFCDKRSKFVHYHPRTLIMNNLEYDHADIFPDVESIERQFHHMVRTMAKSASVISNAKSPNLDKVLEMGVWSQVTYFNGRDYDLDGDRNVLFKGESLGKIEIPLLGRHNALNALAAVLAARGAGVAIEDSLEALKSFRGVKRRLELKGCEGGVRVYDDFAHHPTAIAETIDALRRAMPSGRVIAVFEPRSNTMKMGTLALDLPGSFIEADAVIVYASKNLSWNVPKALESIAYKTRVFQDIDECAASAAELARPGDALLVMSNGAFGGIHAKILKALSDKKGRC